MTAKRDEVIWLDAERQVSLAELAECTGVSTGVLRELVEYGALSPADPGAGEWLFQAECVVSVRAAARMGKDLDLDLETPVLALLVSCLARIHRLEAELRSVVAQSSAAPR